MAQILKFQVGGQPVLSAEQSLFLMNSVKPTLYFLVGNTAYDLLKFKDLVWHNFDSWINFNDYNSSVKDKSRKFINEVLEELTTGGAKFNPDLTLTIKDNKNNWDPRVGFNKAGPKLFHWITLDIVDDLRGIPHVAMRFLVEVINSPYMQKYLKPAESDLTDLTRKVFDKVVARDFLNSWRLYNDNWSSYSSNDKVRIFRDALKDFKNTTDFSIYTLSSLKDLGPKIDEFIKYLDTNPKLDLDFIDKASSFGFYNMESWMNYTPETPAAQAGQDNNGNGVGNGGGTGGTGGGAGGGGYTPTTPVVDATPLSDPQPKRSLAKGTREIILSDINKVLMPVMNLYLGGYNNKITVPFFINSMRDGRYGFVSRGVNNLEQLMTTSRAYFMLVRRTYNGNEELANSEITKKSPFINRYLMGVRYPNSPYTDLLMNSLISIIINKANRYGEYELLIPGNNDLTYIKSSYDPATNTYIGIDKNNRSIFALPAIFIKNTRFWQNLTDRMNTYLKNNTRNGADSKTYTLDLVYSLALISYYKDKIPQGALRKLLEPLHYDLYPIFKEGGIVKALYGSLIWGDLSGTYQGKTAEQIRQEGELRRAAENSRRDAERRQRTQALDASDEYEVQLYKDRQNALIHSFDDLKNNLDEHDAWVVGTLLADLVAFGGSLSGGVFNPVADAATVASMVGTIGTVSTDKSLSTLQKIGYGGLNLLLDAFALVPEIGAAGKAAKIGTVAKKAVPILSKLIRYGAMGMAGHAALRPLKKLYDGETLTKEDWTHLAYFAEALLMGNLAGRSVRGGNKYTTRVEGGGTTYRIKTKNGEVPVTKGTYEQFLGRMVRDLRPKKKNKPLFTGTDGTKVYVKDFRKGVTGRARVLGSVKETSAGFRLKTREEVSREMGFSPITVNGKTYYPVPRNYERVAHTMNSGVREAFSKIHNPFNRVEVPLVSKRGEVILNRKGEPIMVKVSKREAVKMSERYEKNRSRTEGEETPATSRPQAREETRLETTPEPTPTEVTPTATPEATPTPVATPEPTPTVTPEPAPAAPRPEPVAPAPVIAGRTADKLRLLLERIDKSVRENLERFNNSAGMRRKINKLLSRSNGQAPLPKIERGHYYYYSDKNNRYYGALMKNLKGKKDWIEELKRKKAIRFKEGGLIPKFLGGGNPRLFGWIPKLDLSFLNWTDKPEDKEYLEIYYAGDESLEQKASEPETPTTPSGQTPTLTDALSDALSGTLVTGSTTYNPEEEERKRRERLGKESWFTKLGRGISSRLLPHHVLAIGLMALAMSNANKVKDLKNQALFPVMGTVNNNLLYQPTFAMSNEEYINLLMGRNNSAAARNKSTDIKAYYGSTFDNTLTNSSVALLNRKEKSTEFLTNQTGLKSSLTTLLDKLETNAKANLTAAAAARAARYTNEEEALNKRDEALLTLLGMYQTEEAKKEEALLTISQYGLKAYWERFSDETINYNNAVAAKNKAMNDYIAKYKAEHPEASDLDASMLWEASAECKLLTAEVNRYKYIKEVNYYLMLREALLGGSNFDFEKKLAQLSKGEPISDLPKKRGGRLNRNKLGGSLTYELRMSLKLQDAMNKMITTEKRERNNAQRELIREYNKNMRLLNKRSEMLLKAALGIK